MKQWPSLCERSNDNGKTWEDIAIPRFMWPVALYERLMYNREAVEHQGWVWRRK